MLQDFPVLVEKDGEFVAHFKSTVAVAPSKTIILGGALDLDTAKLADASNSVKDEALKALIARDLWQVEKAKKK